MRFVALIFFTLICTTVSAKDDPPLLDNAKVIQVTRLLESEPLHKDAKLLRALLLGWEETSTDVVDVVCPGVFSPVPDETIKYSGELLAQFIMGSAVYQLENPSEKGKLMPSQVAGMRSMLKAYQSFLAADSAARIPRFDELVQNESDGKLGEVMDKLVPANCATGT